MKAARQLGEISDTTVLSCFNPDQKSLDAKNSKLFCN